MKKYVVKCIAVTGLDQNFQKYPLALPFDSINHRSGTAKRLLFPSDLAEIVHRYHNTSYQGKNACKAMNAFFDETEKDNLATCNWDWFDGISVQYSKKHDRQHTITWRMFEKTLLGMKEIGSDA